MGSFSASLLLILLFVTPSTADFKYIWFASICLVLLLRLSDALFWQFKLKGTRFDANAARNRFRWGSLLTALLWAIYSVLFYQQMPAEELAAILVVVAGLAGGAATVLAGHKNTASSFVAIVIFPVSILGLMSDESFRQLLGFLGTFFGIVLFFSARKSAGFTRATIELKNQNAVLIQQMHEEKGEVERVNQALSEAYDQLKVVKTSLEDEVERRTDKISQLVNIDPLTGLINRSAFTEKLRELLQKSEQSGQNMALLFVDLNGFKKINDTLGHKTGDAVLTEIAGRIASFANDFHACRWGGDEFLIALPFADTDTAVSVAKALQSRIATPVDVLSNQLALTASVGIAMYPEHSTSELELIQYADFAMFDQKKAMRAEPLVFNHDLYEELKYSQDLRDGLQAAMGKKQFFLCYQPIMDYRSNRPWAFEALLRWDFNGQPVRPDIFIPLAEQSGLMKDIGAWVLHRACIDASQWHHSSTASVSVNVSLQQLVDDDFIDTLDKALLTSRLNPERLHLEITESMFAEDKSKISANLDLIKARKVKVSIDDFGTGYSSLSQLQTLEFDVIKIDRSFVQNLTQGNEAIIRATLFIAREFGCRTVAEGIETMEQAEELTAMGVDYLQGFMYSKPVPNDVLSEWVQTLDDADEQPLSNLNG